MCAVPSRRQAAIASVLLELDATRGEKQTLVQSVRELGAAARANKAEMDDTRKALSAALAEVDLKVREGHTLGQTLAELLKAHQRCTAPSYPHRL